MNLSDAYGYEDDFHGCLLRSARFMRDRQWDRLDVEHLADELEAMAKSEKRELLIRLSVLLMHLLKGQYQAPRRINPSLLKAIEQSRRPRKRLPNDRGHGEAMKPT